MKYLEAGNVEDADERGALAFAAIKRFVDALHNPFEHALVDGLGDRLDGELHLLLVLRLGHEVAAHLELGLEKRACEVSHVEAEQVADLLGHFKNFVLFENKKQK